MYFIILHLLEKTKNSPALQQKYNFLRDSVLGEYFIGTNFEQNPVPSSLWDVTKIVIKTNALTDIFVAAQKALSGTLLISSRRYGRDFSHILPLREHRCRLFQVHRISM
jgi:hypothetical protein